MTKWGQGVSEASELLEGVGDDRLDALIRDLLDGGRLRKGWRDISAGAKPRLWADPPWEAWVAWTLSFMLLVLGLSWHNMAIAIPTAILFIGMPLWALFIGPKKRDPGRFALLGESALVVRAGSRHWVLPRERVTTAQPDHVSWIDDDGEERELTLRGLVQDDRICHWARGGTHRSLARALHRPTEVLILDLRGKELNEWPAELGSLVEARKIHLSSSRLPSPPEGLFANMGKLRVLDLSDNEMTELPGDIGALSQLRELDLSRNELRRLPDSLSRLTGLHRLALADNPFDAWDDEPPSAELMHWLVERPEVEARQLGVKLLSAFGTRRSLPTLEALRRGSPGVAGLTEAVDRALESIRDRDLLESGRLTVADADRSGALTLGGEGEEGGELSVHHRPDDREPPLEE